MPPAYEVLLLNTAIPQIQAAQSGDTYVVPRDIAINATAIISANSATDALRITQTGAGNAILVEDSANPDSTPFVVTAAGDVGIGTSSPGQKLDVRAPAGGIYLSSTTGTNQVALQTNNSGGDFYFGIDNSAGNNFNTGTAYAGVLWRSGANPICFVNNSTEKMRLDSSGNLGLGVTPSAWRTSGDRALQIGSRLALYSDSGLTTDLGNNVFVNASSQFTYLTTAAATRYQQHLGAHSWLTAASGNAGDPVTFNQAMTLDASGNLGVGITNPAVRLAVNGAARVGANVVGQYVEFSHDTANGLLSTNTGALGYSAPSFHYWSIGGTERARIDASGNLLVGSTVATGKLTFPRNSTISWESGGVQDQVIYADNSSNLRFQTSNTERARIAGGNGNFLVQVTDPAMYDTNAGGDVNTYFRFKYSGGNGSTNVGVALSNDANDGAVGFWRNNSASKPIRGAAIQSNFTSTTAGSEACAITFLTQTGGAAVTERARITSGGEFLLGTANAAGTSGVGVALNPSSNGVRVVSAETTNAAETFSMYSTGASAYRFYVDWSGKVNATNTTIAAISDQRLKENVRDLDDGLGAIMSLKPRKFDWKAGKGKDIKDDRGFIAQEFEQVFPDMIDNWKDPAPEGEEPYKSVRADLIPVLVKALQEQQAMIDELKAEVAALKGA